MMQNLSHIEITSTIKQEKGWYFKTVFFTSGEALKSNDSQDSIFERAREQKEAKWLIKREREILLDVTR